jgi:hypothetical protein
VQKKRGVSLGLLGVTFFIATPIALILAWWHPAFRANGKRDPLLVLCVLLYAAIFVYAAIFLDQ